jgi:cell division septation protein DedD
LIRETFLMSPSGVPPQVADSTAPNTESTAAAVMEAPPTSVLRLPSTSVEEGEIQIPEVTEPAPTMEGPTTSIPEANFTIQVAAFREYQDAVSLSTLLQDYGHPS